MNISIKLPVLKLKNVYWRVPRFWPRRHPLLNFDNHELIKARIFGKDVWLKMHSASGDTLLEKGTVTLRYSKTK